MKWLQRQLKPGYLNLIGLLKELDKSAVDSNEDGRHSLCISMCGSHQAMLRVKHQLAEAQGTLINYSETAFELAADYE